MPEDAVRIIGAHRVVLAVDEEPVETEGLGDLRDVHGARLAQAEADGELAGSQLPQGLRQLLINQAATSASGSFTAVENRPTAVIRIAYRQVHRSASAEVGRSLRIRASDQINYKPLIEGFRILTFSATGLIDRLRNRRRSDGRNMEEITFEQFVAAIQEPTHQPAGRLIVADKPVPFVAPKLHCAAKGNPFAAEVVFVKASAAVGKSTMARFLSATKTLPFLDLAEVPVSTGSLKSLVSDLTGTEDPVKAFHGGQVSIVVDALDEGRLLSGETGFEYFLQTTGEFLLQDRSIRNRPKLIVFGRHESIADAETWLSITGQEIATSAVEVGFFSEKDARALIDAYANVTAEAGASYRQHPGPAQELVDAYFNAIEAALGLSIGKLWASDDGKAFAGYAPVLAALGSLLAKMDNFKDVANRLKSEGRREAWAVIETVLEEILKRERQKLTAKLEQKLSVPVPEEAYDAGEQLTFLTRRVHDQPIGTSTRVRLPASDQAQYQTMVKQYLGDHPFVRQGKPSNAVLGSVILAHAVTNDLLGGANMELLAGLSRQPFLWRSMRKNLGFEDVLIDGRYFGYILNSYWNDPIVKRGRVVVRSVEEGAAVIQMPIEVSKDEAPRELKTRVTLPLRFHGQMRDADVEVQGEIDIEGQASTRGQSAFFVSGKTSVIGQAIEVSADTLTIDGELWLEAESVSASARLALQVKKGARVGWGKAIADTYPWNGLTSTLQPPYEVKPDNVLAALLSECSLRLPDRVLVINDDYSFSPSENQWVARNFAKEFPELLKLLRKHGLVRPDAFGTYAQNKFRLHMETKWSDLKAALNAASSDARIKGFMDEARRVFRA